MTDFARLVLDADTSGLKSAESDLRGLTSTAGKTAADIGKSMRNLGLGLSAGVTAPLAFFAKGAAQAAIDAEEMGSAFDVVFGKMANDVRAWAEETGNALGRSTQEIQRGALAFQELFGKSLAPEQAAEMSKQFAVLTQDLASFKNLSNEVAQQKLFAGLIGEAEPLRSVGVLIDEASVKAKGLEMGLGGVNGELSQQEKILARAALIQEQLAAAQGDVLRTGESTANQIRRSQAAFEELQVVIGTKLLPVLTPLIEKLGGAIEWFSSLPTPVQDTVLVVGGLAAALGPILAALGSIITIAPAVATAFGVVKVAALGLMANPVILGFAAVLAGIYLAWKNWDKITDIVSKLYQGVKTWLMDKLSAVFNWLRDKIKAVTGFFFDMYDAVVGNSYVPDMVEEIGAEFRKLQFLMVDPARQAAEDVKGAMRNMASEVSSLLARLFPEMEAARRQAADIALLRSAEREGLISADTRREGVRRLQGFNEGPLAEVEKVREYAKDIIEEMAKVTEKTTVQTVQIAESFQQMSQRVIGSLQGLANSIRSGDFLGILGGVLDIFMQLGSAGVFGSGLKGRLNSSVAGARALGGQVNAGRTYLVGERGPELFTPAGHGRITANDNMGGRVHVTVGIDQRSGNLTAFVNDQIAATAPAIAGAGAAMAQGQMAARARRRVR